MSTCKGNISLTLIFLLLGVLLISFSLAFRFNRSRILSFAAVPRQSGLVSQEKIKRIVIDAVDINLDVEESGIVDGVWQISEKGASHLDISSYPGQEGNIVVYGHNKGTIFGRLRQVMIGNKVQLVDDRERIYTYQVKDVQIVSPKEVKYVQPTNQQTLTIYTCTGIFDSQRLVLVAEPY